MDGERDLGRLLAAMRPRVRAGSYVFVSLPPDAPSPHAEILASVTEPEGLTLVVTSEEAGREGLDYDFVAAWITLHVHSALAAVGLTAAVATALAAESISCNVLAGRFHDHLLVPEDRAADALAVLDALGDDEPSPANARLRPAVPADAAAMRAIVERAYGPYLERIDRAPAPMTADYDAVATGGNAWVAERDGQLVSLLVVVPMPDHLLVENVAVDPVAQGQGLGRRLLRRAEREARALGLAKVRLYTNEAMTENLAYYPKQGYRETHRAVSDGFRRVHFAKLLDC